MTQEEFELMHRAHKKCWKEIKVEVEKPREMNIFNTKCPACYVADPTETRGTAQRCKKCPITIWRMGAISSDNTSAYCLSEGALYGKWRYDRYNKTASYAQQIADLEWSWIEQYKDQELGSAVVKAMEVYLAEETKSEPLEENYLKGHQASGLKVGDRVKITHTVPTRYRGWHNSWNGRMNLMVGGTFVINQDGHEKGFHLNKGYSFPWFVLEKVEQELPEGIQKAVNDMNSQLCNENFIRYTEEIVKYIDERTKDY